MRAVVRVLVITWSASTRGEMSSFDWRVREIRSSMNWERDLPITTRPSV